MESTIPTLVLLLAGGQGRRLGGAKPGAVLAGRTLLSRALALAGQWSQAPVLAVRDRAQLHQPGQRRVVDDPALAGPLAGLASGARLAAREGARHMLVLPADMPFLPADLASRLAGALAAQETAGCALAASVGQVHPVCSLWRVPELGAALPGYAASGRSSLIGLARLLGAIGVDWPADGGRDPFFNINTPEDLERAERMLAV